MNPWANGSVEEDQKSQTQVLQAWTHQRDVMAGHPKGIDLDLIWKDEI